MKPSLWELAVHCRTLNIIPFRVYSWTPPSRGGKKKKKKLSAFRFLGHRFFFIASLPGTPPHPSNFTYVDIDYWSHPPATRIRDLRLSGSSSISAASNDFLYEAETAAASVLSWSLQITNHTVDAGTRCCPHRGKMMRCDSKKGEWNV